MTPARLRYHAVSDVGRIRKKNDDSGYAGPHLLLVADGMGGAPAGDLASSLAVTTMRRLDAPPPDDMLEALAGAVHRANDRLAEAIEENPAVDGMGTTLSVALFDGSRIAVAHLGDSRGYLWRDGELLRITADHSWVQSLIDEGRISEEEAKTHSYRSMLLRVLDGRHDNDPDLTLYDVAPGDRILLCSDGLSGFVPHERLEQLMSAGTAEAIADELVELALDSGSNDNVTVVVADVVDEPASGEPVPMVVGAAAAPLAASAGKLRALSGRGRREAEPDDDVDPEELRYASRPPKRLRVVRGAIVALVLLLLLGLTGAYAYGWTQDQYYVAADGDQVAIYRGIQADLPGVRLHSVYETQDLSLDQLPSGRRTQVQDGMTAGSLDEARAIVTRLEGFARTCATASNLASGITTSSSGGTSSSSSHTSSMPRTPSARTPRGSTDTAGSTAQTPRTSARTAASAAAGTPSASLPTTGAVTTGSSSDSSDSTNTETGGSGSAPEDCAGATPGGTAGTAGTAGSGASTGASPAATSAATATSPETSR